MTPAAMTDGRSRTSIINKQSLFDFLNIQILSMSTGNTRDRVADHRGRGIGDGEGRWNHRRAILW